MLLCLPWGGPGHFPRPPAFLSAALWGESPTSSPAALAGQRPSGFLCLLCLGNLSLKTLTWSCPLSSHYLLFLCGWCPGPGWQTVPPSESVTVLVWDPWAIPGAPVRMVAEVKGGLSFCQSTMWLICFVNILILPLWSSVYCCLTSSWAISYLFIILAKNF